MKKVIVTSLSLLTVAFVVVIGILVSLLTGAGKPEPPLLPNQLTADEIEDGWVLLFDGKSPGQWHTYGKQGIGSAWKASESTLMLDVPKRAGNKAEGGGDIVTNEVFSGDFEFKADWKVSPLANTGIFFFVKEDTAYSEMYHTGLEFQVTDNAIFAEVQEDNMHRAGDIFGLANSKSREVVNPAGEWNQLHIIWQDNRLTAYMNDERIHDIDLAGDEWKDAIQKSALKDAPVGKGEYVGRIGVQDWGSTSWYRNIKIRML